MTTTLGALIVDDEAPARKRLRDLLDAEAGAEIVAECAEGAAAVEAIREHRPDMVEKLGPGFVRIHRSHAVNLDRVRELQPWSRGEYRVMLADGAKLRSSRTYSGTLQELLGF